MPPPVARKDLEAENAELKKALAEMERKGKEKEIEFEREMSSFKEELLEVKKGSVMNKSITSIEERFSSFEVLWKKQYHNLLQITDNFEVRLDALEQYSRRNCLLIHGIPEKPKEDCIATASAVFRDKISVSIDSKWLDRAHRVGSPRTKDGDKPRPIIVKFVSYQDRDRVWINKKSLKGSGILITESLTKTRNAVLQAAKDLVGHRNAWTQDGKIVFLRPNGSKVYATTLKDVDAVRDSYTPSNSVRSRRR